MQFCVLMISSENEQNNVHSLYRYLLRIDSVPDSVTYFRNEQDSAQPSRTSEVNTIGKSNKDFSSTCRIVYNEKELK